MVGYWLSASFGSSCGLLDGLVVMKLRKTLVTPKKIVKSNHCLFPLFHPFSYYFIVSWCPDVVGVPTSSSYNPRIALKGLSLGMQLISTGKPIGKAI